MSKYDINYGKLPTLLMPMCLRGGRLQAIASVLLSPLVNLKKELIDFRDEKHYKMTHNAQTCYLRAVLNDRFDPTQREVNITEEGDDKNGIILHERSKELFTRIKRREDGFTELFRRGYGGVGNIDFWVNIPARLKDSVDVNAVHAVVDMYKLASVRYGITYNN